MLIAISRIDESSGGKGGKLKAATSVKVCPRVLCNLPVNYT